MIWAFLLHRDRKMPTLFKGFPAESKGHSVPLPTAFFSELLPQIDQLGELKVTVHAFRLLEQKEGAFRWLRRADFARDQRFMLGMGTTRAEAETALDEALGRATERGTLLRVDQEDDEGEIYFLNSPKGRAALRALQNGQWRPISVTLPAGRQVPPPPNIFSLYEENIGPLTPLLADALKEAEDTYPNEWIADAIRIAVEKNKRSWRYIGAILERWRREGRYGKKETQQDRPDSAEDRRRYVEGEFSEFVEH
jgi:DNA replication protein